MSSPHPKTILCCRYQDGSHLALNVSSSDSIRASDMEKALTKRLKFAEDDNFEELVFSVRYDAHWLRCQPPKYWPLGTILGVAEDEGDENLEIELFLYRPQETTSCCSCQAPHSDWKRGTKPQKERQPKSKLSLAWIDFRNQHAPLLKSKSGVVHFLRSILTSSNAASPWVVDDMSSIPDIFVLVVDEPLPILEEFRVSDAAPSWFLHAKCECEELESNNQFLKPNIDASSGPGTLYVYKRLATRPWLTTHHPVETSEKTAEDCLWEMLPPEEEDTETPNGLQSTPKENRYQLQCPPYVHFQDEFPERFMELFEPCTLKILTEEALRIPQWTPWPETQHYSVSSDGNTKPWTVFPLCYCFPADQPDRRKWVEATKRFCPESCRILQETLGTSLRTALFSQLAPGSCLEAHTGWADLANHVLRLHVPLIVPPGGLCGTWVDGCVETHAQARPLIFDDSKIHRAFNYSNQSRIILIVDIERPSRLPSGHASGGHSEELDGFIQQMSQPR